MKTPPYEVKYFAQGIQYVAGTDEAGRGPLAGPVVAAAVIFPPHFDHPEINDSKALSDHKRRKLFDLIKKHALSYAIAIVGVDEIDHLNIYQASRKAMKEALSKLTINYQAVLTDAMPLSTEKVPVEALIKGDQKSLAIAAASILAKVTRDNIMIALDEQYPQYGFKDHKGYGTKAHMDALKTYGPLQGIHRKSYKPIANIYHEQLKLF
ncbi:MAG: ribonuclease HII [Methanomicrobia archaeon]|nr:ribonuclease HII [Methanomicrobia archaeon]